MTDGAVPLRVGILRSDRPTPLIATIEARVIRAELERRLGPVSCDLRIDGDPVGPWSSRATAAWPADVDLVVDDRPFWSEPTSRLSSLFGRTVDAEAVEVRTRMLGHLGVTGPITDAVLTDDIPWRPTDVWIIARRDGVADDADPALRALITDPAPSLDAAFDRVSTDLLDAAGERRVVEMLTRLRARVADLEARLSDEAAEQHRRAVEAEAQLAALEAELSVLRERADRTSLDDADGTPGDP